MKIIILIFLVLFNKYYQQGACCFDNASCLFLTEIQCLNQNGYYNNNITCNQITCYQQFGSCCTTLDSLCRITLPSGCSNINQTFLGSRHSCKKLNVN